MAVVLKNKKNMSARFIFVAAFLVSANALTMNIPARSVKCVFSDILHTSDTLTGTYEVSSGGFMDIDVKVLISTWLSRRLTLLLGLQAQRRLYGTFVRWRP